MQAVLSPTCRAACAVVGLAALALAAACGSTSPSVTETDPLPQEAEPDDHALLGTTMAFQAPRIWSEWEAAPDDANKRYDLADDRGRVVLVHFWASWCVPCRAAMPHYDQMLKARVGAPFEVVALNVDQDRDTAQSFLGEVPVSFVNIYDEGKRISTALEVKKLPLTVLLDREGVVREVWHAETLTDKAAVEARVDELLGPL